MVLMMDALGAMCELMAASRAVDLESRFVERRVCDASVMSHKRWANGRLNTSKLPRYLKRGMPVDDKYARTRR